MQSSNAAAGGRYRAWIEIDPQCLMHNVALLRARLPQGCELMPALKANAYGHGAVPVARMLNACGIHAFCVATAQEGAALRREGIRGLILVLGYTHPALFSLLDRNELTQAVVDYDYAKALSGYGRALSVHIALDTGMHRLGESHRHFAAIEQIYRLPHLRVEGIFTHLCTADASDPQGVAYAHMQGEAFYQTVEALKARGCLCKKAHILSSYGLFNHPQLAGDYARVGIALYGLLSTRADTERLGAGLRPVLSLKARIASVKTLRSGERAGYGLSFVAGREARIAVLAIGYADGLPRALSCGAGSVLVHGRAAPIAGRVCMDQTLIDVTDIPRVRPGDVAVIIGRSGDAVLSACDLAAQAGTISNEILSRLGARLERVIVRRADGPAQIGG